MLQCTPRCSILSADTFFHPLQLLNLTDMKETSSTDPALTNSSNNCSTSVSLFLPKTQLNKSQGHSDEGECGNEMILSDDSTPNCHSETKAAAANSGYVSDSFQAEQGNKTTSNLHFLSQPNTHIRHLSDLNSPHLHDTHSLPDQSSHPFVDSGCNVYLDTTSIGGSEHGSHTSSYTQTSLKEANGLVYSEGCDLPPLMDGKGDVEESTLDLDDQVMCILSSEDKSGPSYKYEYCENRYIKMAIPHSEEIIESTLPQCDDLPPI